MVQCKHGVIAYACTYTNISVVSAVFIKNFQHNQQYDTLLPVTPCVHELKAGIAYCAVPQRIDQCYSLSQWAVQ